MAYEKAKNILANHETLALSADAKGTIKDLLEEFEANVQANNRTDLWITYAFV